MPRHAIHVISCTPVGLESWGRLGVSASSFLTRLAAQAAELQGISWHRLERRWRAELGVALFRAYAETVRQATRRRRDVDDADAELSHDD